MTQTREEQGWTGSRVRAAMAAPVRVTVQLPATLQPAFERLQVRANKVMERGVLVLVAGLLAGGASWLVYRGTFTTELPSTLTRADVPAAIAEGFTDQPDQLDKLRRYIRDGMLQEAKLRQADDKPLETPEADYVLAQSAYFALNQPAAPDMSSADYQAPEKALRTHMTRLVPQVDAHPEHYDARTLYVLEQSALKRLTSGPARSVARAVEAERVEARRWGALGYAGAGPLVIFGWLAYLLGRAMEKRVERIKRALGRTT